jgi:hypothetical protein
VDSGVKIFRTGELAGVDLDLEMEAITRGCEQAFIPKDDDMDITHYWLFFENHRKCAYFGTPESFAKWQRERIC